MHSKFGVICAVALFASRALAAPSNISGGQYRASMSLDGTWETVPIQGATLTYPPPTAGWTASEVPNSSPASLSTPGGAYRPRIADMLTPDGKTFKRQDGIAAWFRRSFTIPNDAPPNRRLILHFDGMAFHSVTWLNGHQIGDSSIGQIAQDYDVTSLVKAGQDNQLVVGIAGREGIFDLASKSFTAPASGVVGGIWGDVSLRFVPKSSIDDVFVTTSVRKQQLTVATTVLNADATTHTFQLDGEVTDAAGEVQCLIPAQSVTAKGGKTATATLSKDWLASKLWSPESPALYFVRLRLRDGQTIIDEQTQRFGYREFWISGRDFYLNGNRVTLRRNSVLFPVHGNADQAAQLGRSMAGRPFNAIRLHIGFDNEALLDAADRYGLMAIPEAAWYNTQSDYSLTKPDLWVPNQIAYQRALMHANRNHPSVVIWNLTNESFWFNTDPERMKIADQLIAAATAEDPTRPLEGDGETTWGGRLPIINVHYPEWDAGDVRAKYPNASFVLPNDLYWLKDDKTPSHGWRADFTWDRPLVIGEYWCLDGGPDEKSSFLGETAYDWEKWRWQDIGGRDMIAPNRVTEIAKMTTDAYRVQGVAGINPWTGDRQDVMPNIAVRPLDFHPNFYAGSTGTRKFAVFCDSNPGIGKLVLQCNLTVNGTVVWQKVIDVPPAYAKPQIVDVAFKCPDLAQQATGTLKVRLYAADVFAASGAGADLSHDFETIHIMPAPRWTGAQPTDVVLYDPSGQTAKAIQSLGLTLTAKSSLTEADLTGRKLVIVGAGADVTPIHAALDKFVTLGGRTLLLSVANPNALSSELPEVDPKHAASEIWLRAHNAPALGGLEESQLSYWMPDNIVSTNTPIKPSQGNYKILLDAGGLYGLKWTPLVEVGRGAGQYVVSSLSLVDKIGIEPAADKLLLSLIQTERTAASPLRHPFRLLAAQDAPLHKTLAACSIVTTRGLTGDGPILVDSTSTATPADLAAIKAYLATGGTVWLHGFTPETIAKVASLFPFTPTLVEADKTVLTAQRSSDDPWMDSLSSFDFAWARIDTGYRGDYFNGAKPTAAIGKYELVAPRLTDTVRLTSPGFLTKVPVGQGAILMDTLGWTDALNTEAVKATRVATALAQNIGGKIVLAPAKQYRYITTDFSKVANRGYIDETAGDGKGGWNDSGANDMRYFLINQTGKNGGMDVPTPPFPTRPELAGRPFAMIDPKANDDKAIIVLRGNGHDLAAPASVAGIAVNAKADKLWFLHGAAWANPAPADPIATYIVHYTDGTTASFPIRAGIEVTDWWSTDLPSTAKVGWSGKNDLHSPLTVYVAEWTNPHPEKPISTIDVNASNTPAQLMVLGITAGQELPTQTP